MVIVFTDFYILQKISIIKIISDYERGCLMCLHVPCSGSCQKYCSQMFAVAVTSVMERYVPEKNIYIYLSTVYYVN